MTQKHYI